MKVVQVFNSIVHWETPYASIAECPPFAPDIIIVEAPDNVFPGWGYLEVVDPETGEGTGAFEFVKPTAPDGWAYDDATGTFYPIGGAPEQPKTPDQIIAEQDLIILDLTYENILLKEGLQ